MYLVISTGISCYTYVKLHRYKISEKESQEDYGVTPMLSYIGTKSAP